MQAQQGLSTNKPFKEESLDLQNYRIMDSMALISMTFHNSSVIKVIIATNVSHKQNVSRNCYFGKNRKSNKHAKRYKISNIS